MRLPAKRSAVQRRLTALQFKAVHAIHRAPGKILLAVLAVSLVSGFFTFKLFQDVRTDFATLLPENDRSVVHVKEATKRMGGVGNIFVSISSPDFDANKRFAEAFSAVLKKYPKDLIKFFEYRTTEAAEFFKEHLFYYLTMGELAELRAAMRKRFEKTRLGAIGLDLDESNPDAQIKRLLTKIFKKYRSENPFGANKDGYFTDEAGRLLAIIIRPAGDAADQKFSRLIVDRLNADIAALGPEKFHPQMEVGLAGTYVALLQNFASIIQDTVETAGLTIFLVLVSIWFFYRSVRMVAMLCAGILVGILLTFTITYFKIGYLNQQTAFLASIIVGNGINFGLILLARYLEERGHGLKLRRALNRSVFLTISATFMAAVATSISYGILSVTTFKGFSQFGFIGGVGMLICWAALNAILPCFIVLFERWRPQKQSRINRYIQSDHAHTFAAFVHARRRILLYLMYVVVPVSLAGTWLYLRADRFEYDLKKLTLKVSEGKGSENYYMKRIDSILGNGDNPSVLIARNRAEAHATGQVLENKIREAKESGKRLFINSVRWLDQFYPQDQERKFAIVRDLRRLFLPKYLALLSKDEREWGKVALKALKKNPFRTEDLPEMVLRNFREADGTLGRVLFVTAGENAVLSNIRDLMQIGHEIGSAVKIAPGRTAGDGEVLFASESMIFIDILGDVSKEGPLVTLVCFLAVGAFIWLGFRRLREFFFVYLFLALGLLAFIASLYFFGIKLNFFNFITIPITIGIGVDYAINLYYRYKVDGERSIRDAVAHTGSAVALCSWTTIIGYGTMLWAKNQAMASFGLMAVIGEIACLGFALVFMPALLGVREDRRNAQVVAALPGPAETSAKKTASKPRTRKVSAKKTSGARRK